MAPKSEALKIVYASAPADQIILETIEIRHPAFVDNNGNVIAFRVVANNEDLNATLEADAEMNGGELVLFVAMAFSIDGVGFGDNKVPSLQIRITNVQREMSRYMELAATNPNKAWITYREYLPSDLSGPQMDPPVTLACVDIQIDPFACTITADATSLQNRAFPKTSYTTARFPGLNR